MNSTEYRKLVNGYIDDSAHELIRQEIIPEVSGKGESFDIQEAANKVFREEIANRQEYMKSLSRDSHAESRKVNAEIRLLHALEAWIIEKIKNDPKTYINRLDVYREMNKQTK